jgi:hypothetical protein
MKMKQLLLVAAAILGLTAAAVAQNVPSYVPTNGLVGWWPFNGNANDESGNGNNGTVNGATLATDRFGNANKAYYFSSDAQNINCGNSPTLGLTTNSDLTISYWTISSNSKWPYISKYQNLNPSNSNYGIGNASQNYVITGNGQNSFQVNSGNTTNWVHLSLVFQGNVDSVIVYVNGIFNQKKYLILANNVSTSNLIFGPRFNPLGGNYQTPNGNLDDICMWNRALTQQEITELYNAVNCFNNTSITPQTNSLITASTATFTATTSDPNPSFVWQSDFGQGFQTLNNFGNYSGVNTASIHISNVQLSEHNQPIRVISTSGNCIDTSNVASILVSDTCITTMTDTSIVLITDTNIVTVTDTNYVTIVDTNYVTITDTSFITVTDTLLIQTTITGINPPNNSNTLRVFPNPTNDHITIDYGNFGIMNGYQIKIENSLGQQVFQTNITQQSDYIGLMNWGGNGLYFVRIIDPQGNTIDIRKIVLQ